MADKGFGVREFNFINAIGVPTIESPNNLNINAISVGISTDLSIGGKVISNVIVGTGYSVGIGTTVPTSKVTVIDGDVAVGVNTSYGIVLTSPNGSRYRLIVDNSGNLSTTSV